MLIDHSHTPPFVIYKQTTTNDCAFACLKMLCQYHGLPTHINTQNYIHLFSSIGLPLHLFTDIAEELGFRCLTQQGTFEDLCQLSASLPFVALWRGVHLVVVYDIAENLIKVADPRVGILGLTYAAFTHDWLLDNTQEGIVILFEKI